MSARQPMQLSDCAEMFRRHPDSVLFVTSQLRPRELKLAKGLRRLGWKTAVLYYHWTPFEPTDEFDFSLPVGSAEEARRAAKELEPRICHVFSGAIDDLVLTFCRDKPCPVVIDLNDVFAPSMFDYCHERFEPTREALALADGFCARDLQASRAQRIDGFSLPPHVIFFPEYCWSEREVPVKSEVERLSQEVRVVSVGTFSLETQGMYDSCYLQLVNLFIEQRIHFHIYPHWSYRRDHHGSPHAKFESDFADFIDLEKRSPYLHVHESLDLNELAEVLPQYDFGIVSGGCEAFGQRLRYYKPAYLETCYSGRISDYLDARLPVMVNDEVEFDFRLLRHYGVCVDLKGVLQADFKDQLLARKRDPGTRAAVDRAAIKMSVQHNAPRLARFYSQMIEAGKRTGIPESTRAYSALPPPPLSQRVADRPPEGALVETGRRLARALGLQRAAPRIARGLLPYRTIRLLEGVAHHEKTENAELVRNNVLQRLELERLTREVDSLSTDVGALEERERRQQALIVTARKQLSMARAIGDELAREKAALQSLVSDLSEQLGGMRGRSSTLQSEMAALREQVRGLEGENAVLRARAEGIESTCAALTGQLDARAGQVAALTGQIEAMAESGRRLAAELEATRRREAAAQGRIGELTRDNEALELERGRFARSVSVLEAENGKLETEIVTVRSQLEASAAENAALRTGLDALERNSEELRSKASALETANTDLIHRVHILSNERFVLQQASTIGGLPLHELAGALNWTSVIDDVQRVNGHSELVRMMALYAASEHAADVSSNCWTALSVKNFDQLLASGYDRFKRTVGLNYFNFAVQAGDPQIVAVESLLPSDEVNRCAVLADAMADDPTLPWRPQREYRRFVAMLWAYAKAIDAGYGLTDLSEPEEGGPIRVDAGDHSVTQDLANAVLEYHAIREGVSFDGPLAVLEIGGGYGRTVYPMLARHPDLRVTMVDIPPALYLAQRYLSSVFRERHVFRVRTFDRYENVKEEMEQASIVFLMPHQLGLLPARCFDLALNVSSFGEMGAEQIRWYFEQLERTVRGYTYLKQWRRSDNVFDRIVIQEADYPYPKSWRRIYSRRCAVQTDFFEALFQADPTR